MVLVVAPGPGCGTGVFVSELPRGAADRGLSAIAQSPYRSARAPAARTDAFDATGDRVPQWLRGAGSRPSALPEVGGRRRLARPLFKAPRPLADSP